MEDRHSRKIDRWLNTPVHAGRITFKMLDLVFLACIWIIAAIIRFRFINVESPDYFGFLEPWMDRIRELGPLKSVGTEISNYSPAYMYLMAMVAAVTKNSLAGLKIVSFIFDYAASVAVFLLVRQITEDTGRSVTAMAVLLLCPTVFIDSAWWCQCDMIYSCFLLYAVYELTKGNSRKCMIFVGLSFMFKLQAVFILPLLLLLWMKDHVVKLRHFLYVPVIYCLSVIPAWIAGRDLKNLLGLYFTQGNYYPWGTLEYPNLYVFLDETMDRQHFPAEVSGAGMFFFVGIMGLLAYWFYRTKFRVSYDIIITTAVLTAALTVYTLPHMHERYGFMIDLLAIPWCALRPRRIPVMCGFFMVSVLSFMPYLTAVHVFPPEVMAAVQLTLIGMAGYELWRTVRSAARRAEG